MILRPTVISPDTSHWSKWIDAALSSDAAKRVPARDFHKRLVDQGKIPLLSWHHFQELLCHENDAKVRERIGFLQNLPMISWVRPARDQVGLGSIVDVLTYEAIACDAGCSDVMQVRESVRPRLLQTGPGIEAIGPEDWVWDVTRPIMIAQRLKTAMVAAIGGMRFADESQTIGEIAKQAPRPIGDKRKIFAGMHTSIMQEAIRADPRRTPEEARWMADEFLAKSAEWMPEGEVSSRDYTIALYAMAGLDPGDVRDECTMEELSTLAAFRKQLRIVANNSHIPFERLKRIDMEFIPSRRIIEGLRRFGQRRTKRPGSDMHDQYLAALAAYTDVLYVDRRTIADLNILAQKDRQIASLLGDIRKAANFSMLAE